MRLDPVRRAAARSLTLALLCGLVSACTAAPAGVEPVQNFDLNRYLGTWYEIARLDHRFERGLSRVSAEYSLRDDGGVRVVNRGYKEARGRWKDAQGKAYFVGEPDQGHLKVSFFGPFYGGYIVFELDHEAYQYAFVAGNSTSYLWLLARTPTVSQDLIDRFVQRAGELGFDTDELIMVDQSKL